MMDIISEISHNYTNETLSGLLSDADWTPEERLQLDTALDFFVRPFELAKEYHRNTKRQRMDFSDKPYLIPIYYDISPEKVIQKSVQCGISEMLICISIAYAEKGYSVLYVLPKFALRGRFVANRIDPLLEIVPEYRNLLENAIGDSDSMTLKHLGQGVINFVGSNSASEFIEFPADLIIVDELDRCDLTNLELADDRLDASELKHKIKISTPTTKDFGINNYYSLSDQKEWHIKCESCNEWQPILWDVNVVRQISENDYELLDTKYDKSLKGKSPKGESKVDTITGDYPEGDYSQRDYHVFCHKCGNPIDRLSKGEWVRKNDSLISGYHISQLFTPQTTIKNLWELFQEALFDNTKLQVFYNSKLGLPFIPKGSNIAKNILDDCRQEWLMESTSKKRCSMGVDVGSVLHVRISSLEGDVRKAEYIGIVNDFNELSLLIERYNVRYCVIDMYPETRKVQEFQSVHRNIWLCRFTNSISIGARGYNKKEDDQIIDADRTQVFDRLVASIQRKKLALPKNAGLIDKYYEQMQAPVRKKDEDKNRYYWSEGSNADHYFLAELYDLLAAELILENQLVIY